MINSGLIQIESFNDAGDRVVSFIKKGDILAAYQRLVDNGKGETIEALHLNVGGLSRPVINMTLDEALETIPGLSLIPLTSSEPVSDKRILSTRPIKDARAISGSCYVSSKETSLEFPTYTLYVTESPREIYEQYFVK